MTNPQSSALAPALTHSAEWSALQRSQARMKRDGLSIKALFAADARRFDDYHLRAADLLLDYSKHLLDGETRTQLFALARAAGMEPAIAAMFNGDTVNNTEQRAALHVALRSQRSDSEYEQQVAQTLDRIESFVHDVISGHWKGHDGREITDVVNIGIGGSDLGPAMAYQALAPFHVTHLRCHFVSNVDPVHLEQTLLHLDAATTLFVIASKTFTTMETSLNAQAARAWVLAAGVAEQKLQQHFVAVSTNLAKAQDFGIAPANIFPMWNWVGGRYSLWSAIGLPIALGVGMANFRELLRGASEMDTHFRSAPLEHNMPVLMALLTLWYANFWGAQSQAILPYAQNLHLFPAFLQQLDMESLGKQLRKDGQLLDTASGSIVWGSAGTNGQHSFHQLLHQGTHLIPADFIAVADSASSNREQQEQLLANCFAQSQALMDGKSLEEATAELRKQGSSAMEAAALAPHKVIPGNRPSNTLLLPKLTPATLGALVALYEHKVYAHSVLLGINAFDQWGVELGKVLSTGIYKAITAAEPCVAFDGSTNALIELVKQKAAE